MSHDGNDNSGSEKTELELGDGGMIEDDGPSFKISVKGEAFLLTTLRCRLECTSSIEGKVDQIYYTCFCIPWVIFVMVAMLSKMI